MRSRRMRSHGLALTPHALALAPHALAPDALALALHALALHALTLHARACMRVRCMRSFWFASAHVAVRVVSECNYALAFVCCIATVCGFAMPCVVLMRSSGIIIHRVRVQRDRNQPRRSRRC